jgi:Ca2+-binding RTX toxin-like protein
MRHAHVEDLTLRGEEHIRRVGNGLVNVFTGNSGNNILDGGKNNDQLIGGDGNDTYFVRAPKDTVIELEDGGIDVVRAFKSMRIPENVERMYLQTEIALNGMGNDQANLIVGNMADNILAGRGGRETLNGLGGSDTFVFDRAPDNNNVDRIIDFASGDDNIWLKASLFGLTAGDVSNRAFHLGTQAADRFDRFIFDSDKGGLWVDPDGTGPQRQFLTLVLEDDAELTASDLFVF